MLGRISLAAAALLGAAALIRCGGSGPQGDGSSRASVSPPASAGQVDVTGPRLAAAGDIACPPGLAHTSNTCDQRETANIIERLDPDVVAPLGDLQYQRGSLAAFRRSYAPTWGRFRSRSRPALGNHEYATAGAAGYFAYWGSRGGPRGRGWYSYDLGSWYVVVLNANCTVVGCGRGSAQLSWLHRELTRHPAKCTLAYWHQPRFSSGLHGNDPNVAPLWRELYAHRADLILNGHDHDYERFGPQSPAGRAVPGRGIVEFVVGTGGVNHYPIIRAKPNSRVRRSFVFGVLGLTLGDGRYAWSFHPQSGSRFRDEGTGTCV